MASHCGNYCYIGQTVVTFERETRRHGSLPPSLSFSGRTAGEASQDVNPIRELDATSWRVTAWSRRMEEGGWGRSRGIVIFERGRRIFLRRKGCLEIWERREFIFSVANLREVWSYYIDEWIVDMNDNLDIFITIYISRNILKIYHFSIPSITRPQTQSNNKIDFFVDWNKIRVYRERIDW